jgi:hypothetical protein
LEGVDFSWARPGGAALKAAGKRFVIRYAPYHFQDSRGNLWDDRGKGLTASEITDYRAHELAIVFNFESAGTRMKSGKTAGIEDARASQSAIDALHMPASLPVYFSVDWGATATDQTVIDAYLRGAASVLGAGRIGVYGSYSVLTRCKANGTARGFWQTYAWSYGKLASFAHLYQYNNGEYINGAVDLDRTLQANYGQWNPPTIPLPPDSSTEEPAPVATVIEFLPSPLVLTASTRSFAASEPFAELSAIGPGTVQVDGVVQIDQTAVPHGVFWRVITGTSGRRLVPATMPLASDCTAAIKAATDSLNARIQAARDALG